MDGPMVERGVRCVQSMRVVVFDGVTELSQSEHAHEERRNTHERLSLMEFVFFLPSTFFMLCIVRASI